MSLGWIKNHAVYMKRLKNLWGDKDKLKKLPMFARERRESQGQNIASMLRQSQELSQFLIGVKRDRLLLREKAPLKPGLDASEIYGACPDPKKSAAGSRARVAAGSHPMKILSISAAASTLSDYSESFLITNNSRSLELTENTEKSRSLTRYRTKDFVSFDTDIKRRWKPRRRDENRTQPASGPEAALRLLLPFVKRKLRLHPRKSPEPTHNLSRSMRAVLPGQYAAAAADKGLIFDEDNIEESPKGSMQRCKFTVSVQSRSNNNSIRKVSECGSSGEDEDSWAPALRCRKL